MNRRERKDIEPPNRMAFMKKFKLRGWKNKNRYEKKPTQKPIH
ncbi:MAG: hypothetical protein QW052_06190 [Candidatus Nitrosocaldaceae archaeon]